MAKQSNDIRDIVRNGVKANRAADNLKVCNSTRGGFTTWRKRKVTRIDAPLVKGAQARTIRIHELLHANRSPVSRSRKFPDLAQQAVEDARVHSVYWPKRMPRRANRDCLTSALLDMRTIPPMAQLGRAEDWNRNLLVALRAMAIFQKLNGSPAGLEPSKARGNLYRLKTRLENAFGEPIVEALQTILSKVKSRRGQALKLFAALLREDEEQPESNCAGSGSHGKKTKQPMRIVRLPLVQACNSAIRRTSLARSGARLSRPRLSRAVATGSTNGLFIRTRYLQGGTYLFDASGSMHLTDRRLGELCRAVPAATVAYYSGAEMDATGCYGELVIYAENGKRAAEVANVWGGNEIDLYALQWLLKQPAPRYFVSDGQFCGGPAGQDIAAHILLVGAVANGDVTWHKTISSLETSLGL